MSATASYFGARAVSHPSGTIRTETFFPTVSTMAAIYKGDLVKLSGLDTVCIVSGAGDASIGVFDGCRYNDSTGKPVYSPYWPGSTAGATNIEFYVITDIQTTFEIQASIAVAATAIGDSANITYAAGSAVTGQSGSYIAALSGAGAVGNFRIAGVGQQIDNAWGDAKTIVRVTIGANQRFTQVNAI
jgi:hypothetical protein